MKTRTIQNFSNLIVFFSLILLTSCTRKEEIVKDTYNDGSKRVVEVWEKKLFSKRKIEEITYHQSGQVQSRGNYDKNGKRTGLWISYYENGTKWSETHFDSGKMNGKNIAYYQNGQKRYEGFYKNGVNTGHWVFYNMDGQVTNEFNVDTMKVN